MDVAVGHGVPTILTVRRHNVVDVIAQRRKVREGSRESMLRLELRAIIGDRRDRGRGGGVLGRARGRDDGPTDPAASTTLDALVGVVMHLGQVPDHFAVFFRDGRNVLDVTEPFLKSVKGVLVKLCLMVL